MSSKTNAVSKWIDVNLHTFYFMFNLTLLGKNWLLIYFFYCRLALNNIVLYWHIPRFGHQAENKNSNFQNFLLDNVYGLSRRVSEFLKGTNLLGQKLNFYVCFFIVGLHSTISYCTDIPRDKGGRAWSGKFVYLEN